MWVRVPSPAPEEVINLLNKEKKTKELLSDIAKLEKKYEDKIRVVIVAALRESEKTIEEFNKILASAEIERERIRKEKALKEKELAELKRLKEKYEC